MTFDKQQFSTDLKRYRTEELMLSAENFAAKFRISINTLRSLEYAITLPSLMFYADVCSKMNKEMDHYLKH